MANKCKECGCACKKCISSDHDVQLHLEIENLKQRLLEKENHIVTMETNFLNEANKFPSGEIVALREELLIWQDKYKRLYDAHRRVQRVNQGLEDKLLKVVDVCETEKNALTKDVATLSRNLADANYAVKKLTDDNERYKNDVNLAIQFLQCKQSNYVAHRFDALPQEVQNQVSAHMTHKRKPEETKTPPSVKSIKVPIPTFPPTAMVYSIPKSPNAVRRVEPEVEQAPVDIVSAAIMAKVLEERQKERALVKHCDTCTCSKELKLVYDITAHTVGTQTGENKENVCLKCNESLVASPIGMKIVKSSSSIKNKKVPIYPANNLDVSPTTHQNIVKVQPNNFLIDNKSVSNSNSCLVNVEQETTSTSNISVQNQRTAQSVLPQDTLRDTTIVQVNETKPNPTIGHHKLCDKAAPIYEIEPPLEKADSETNVDKTSAKNGSSDNLKGPRYCSMLVQSGSKNILLDNAHNNIPPVVYTRLTKTKREEPAQTHDKTPKIETASLSSAESKMISLASENSSKNRQRVADWVQSNIDNDNVSSSENSRSDAVNVDKEEVNKSKYVEMEENVKRFLFGESEFLKTVEIGKLKYQNYKIKDNDIGGSDKVEAGTNKTVSHTETEI